MAYQPASLAGVSNEDQSWERLHAYMLSAFIRTKRRYPAMLLAEQPVHKRFVLSGPLVLGKGSLNLRSPW